jgi:hypothetical protein
VEPEKSRAARAGLLAQFFPSASFVQTKLKKGTPYKLNPRKALVISVRSVEKIWLKLTSALGTPNEANAS